MLFMIGIEDVEGIAVRNLDDLAGEGIGEGRYGEAYLGGQGVITRTAISLSLDSWI